MSRRKRRERAVAARAALGVIKLVESVVSYARFEFKDASARYIEASACFGGNARRAPRRRRRARVAKRIEARRGFQHYPSARVRHLAR